MRDHNVCFYGAERKITPKLSVTPSYLDHSFLIESNLFFLKGIPLRERRWLFSNSTIPKEVKPKTWIYQEAERLKRAKYTYLLIKLFWDSEEILLTCEAIVINNKITHPTSWNFNLKVPPLPCKCQKVDDKIYHCKFQKMFPPSYMDTSKTKGQTVSIRMRWHIMSHLIRSYFVYEVN